jgi:hypothetical protein
MHCKKGALHIFLFFIFINKDKILHQIKLKS